MPNVMSIMKYFSLRGHTAGSTLLTILVAFPVTFTILRRCTSPDQVDNIISENMGKCFHCLGIVLPIVAFMKTFKIKTFPYLRDQLMIIPFSMFYIHLLDNKTKAPVNISLVFFLAYTAYIIISMMLNFFDIRLKQKKPSIVAPHAGDLIIELDLEIPIYEINFYNERVSHMYEGKYPIPRIVGVNPRSNAYRNFEIFQQFAKSFDISEATNMRDCPKVIQYLMVSLLLVFF